MAPTARPVVKARTRTSAPGNKGHRGHHGRAVHDDPVAGFTLIELLVVLLLIGIASGIASLALRDPSATRLDHEATRLAALLEAGRAEARASGLAIRFELDAKLGFHFVGLPPGIDLPQRWLNEGVLARIYGGRAILLGPEPLIGVQRIDLSLGERHLAVTTDGLAPFMPVAEGPPSTAAKP